MKTIILAGCLVLLMLLLLSCGDNGSVVQQAYHKGTEDAIREVQNKVEHGKQQLMREIQPTLLIGAVIVLLVTFYGDYIAERLREKMVAKLGLTPARQAMLLTVGYLLICAVLAGWSILRCGTEWSFPILLLLIGSTGVFFLGYLPSLFKSERESRRLALSKIKMLLFAAAVILAIHELLAYDGLLRMPG